MEQKIRIHFDFTDGTELPYAIAREQKKDFSTNCLEFFSTSNPNAVVVKKDGSEMSVKELLNNSGNYTKREIRKAHNLHKMLISGVFVW